MSTPWSLFPTPLCPCVRHDPVCVSFLWQQPRWATQTTGALRTQSQSVFTNIPPAKYHRCVYLAGNTDWLVLVTHRAPSGSVTSCDTLTTLLFSEPLMHLPLLFTHLIKIFPKTETNENTSPINHQGNEFQPQNSKGRNNSCQSILEILFF